MLDLFAVKDVLSGAQPLGLLMEKPLLDEVLGKIVIGRLNEVFEVCDMPKLVTVTCASTKTVMVYVPAIMGVPQILPQPCSVVGGFCVG